nr:RecName: Full=Xylose isomerase [Streptomyces sp. 'NCL 82-5-1']
RHAGSAHTF